MKNKCLKYIFYSLSLLGLYFLLPINIIKAENLVSFDINYATGVNVPINQVIPGYQTFTAVNNNISGFGFYADGGIGNTLLNGITFCEVGYNGSNVCIDDAVAPSVTSIIDTASNYQWENVLFTPIGMTIGHFYMVSWNFTVTSYFYYESQNYSGGVGSINGGSDWVSQFFYDDAYIAEFCGDTICQTATENCSTCATDCGTCGTNYGQNFLYSLWFNNPFNCSVNSTCIIRYNYDESIMTPYDYLEIRKYVDIYSTSTTNLIATTTIINHNAIGKENGQSYFTLTSATSTEAIEYYDAIVHYAEYWDANTQQTVLATTSIPYAVNVVWQGASTTNEIIIGIAELAKQNNALIADTACTAEEWSTPDPVFDYGFGTTSLAMFNLTKMRCTLITALWNTGNTLMKQLETAINFAIRKLALIFPFNFPAKFYLAYQKANTTALPADLAFLMIADSSGNITINFPAEWTGTGTTTPMVVWGPAIFMPNGTTLKTFFQNVRGLTTYALWFGFIFGLWKLGQEIIEDLNGHKSVEKKREDGTPN